MEIRVFFMQRRDTIFPILRYAVASIALLSMAQSAIGQDTPVISGAVGFLSTTNKGPTSFNPTFQPVAVVPITRHFLFENRDSIAESVTPRLQDKSDQTRLSRNVVYLQMDYLAAPHVTFVAGKFLTPFASFNEQIGSLWVNNFLTGPLILAIGGLGTEATGGQMRGSLFANGKMNVDYATFFSANVGGKYFTSSRATGGRVNFYLPSSGVQFGASYDHMFEGEHRNAIGGHFWWEPHTIPLTIRSEYAHGTHAQGYWIETGYRLSQINGAESWIGRLEPLFRMQQTFRNSPDSTDGLPAVDEQLADFALDYYLPHEVRIDTSYSRQFSSTGSGNIWRTGLIYRFLFPAWPGKQR
jgi:hypothetical protein